MPWRRGRGLAAGVEREKNWNRKERKVRERKAKGRWHFIDVKSSELMGRDAIPERVSDGPAKPEEERTRTEITSRSYPYDTGDVQYDNI